MDNQEKPKEKTIQFGAKRVRETMVMTPRQETILKTIPIKFRTSAQRSFQGVLSKSAAIKAKCQECVGYEEVTERVGGCTTSICPLWRYRPYQSKV